MFNVPLVIRLQYVRVTRVQCATGDQATERCTALRGVLIYHVSVPCDLTGLVLLCLNDTLLGTDTLWSSD